MADALWLKCVDELKYQVPDNIFTMWIRPLSAQFQDHDLTITVPNQYFANYIEKNHLAQIKTIVHKLEPETDYKIKIRIDQVGNISTNIIENSLDNTAKPVNKATKTASFQNLDANFTFISLLLASLTKLPIVSVKRQPLVWAIPRIILYFYMGQRVLVRPI